METEPNEITPAEGETVQPDNTGSDTQAEGETNQPNEAPAEEASGQDQEVQEESNTPEGE